MTDSSKENQKKTDIDLVKLKENLDSLQKFEGQDIVDMTIKKSFIYIKDSK